LKTQKNEENTFCILPYQLYCKNLQVSLKTQKNEENTFCILLNKLYMFSHRIPSPKTGRDINECIPIHFFELSLTALSTDKFQLIEEYNQAQNNILEVHSLTSHYSYAREFDVRAFIVELV
jgi:hypothetical protein